MGSPGSISSSPVETTMTAGWLLTRTRAMPADAATAISGARSKVPVSSNKAPGAHRCRAGGYCGRAHSRRWCSGMRTPRQRPSCSTGITQSLPAGSTGARHYFNGVIAVVELERRRPGRLSAGNSESPLAAPQGRAVHRDAVHGDPVERRMVAFRIDIFAQRSADALASGSDSMGKHVSREWMASSARRGVMSVPACIVEKCGGIDPPRSSMSRFLLGFEYLHCFVEASDHRLQPHRPRRCFF